MLRGDKKHQINTEEARSFKEHGWGGGFQLIKNMKMNKISNIRLCASYM